MIFENINSRYSLRQTEVLCYSRNFSLKQTECVPILCMQGRLSQLTMIKCINFIRRNTQLGKDVQTILGDVSLGEVGPMGQPTNLEPFIADDGLLLLDYETDNDTRFAHSFEQLCMILKALPVAADLM